MTMVQMNVRIDADLKRTVDAELERLGATPSQLVRDAYRYVGRTHHLPDYEAEAAATGERDRRRRLTRIEQLQGCVSRPLVEAGLLDGGDDILNGMTYQELRDAMYGEKLGRLNEGGE